MDPREITEELCLSQPVVLERVLVGYQTEVSRELAAQLRDEVRTSAVVWSRQHPGEPVVLDDHVRSSMTWRAFIQPEFDRVGVAIRAHVLSERVAEHSVHVRAERVATFRFPSSPWQHLKQVAPRWTGVGSRWFLRRRPVRTERHERTVFLSKTANIRHLATFPDAPAIRTPEGLRGPTVVRHSAADVG